ncbi:uncharacterized protein LOC129578622 isoform X2 [Sitodiplosis mosellana]|uniref:uncharacterized protein LOC129578622 isoform X2 n=1 Tax=Sitodiplosis mosellana TaxID=263140 RepID=UPI00244504F8|nr:uncharacterized protein LOC129578622 isoform X2 [Sitodiplosis mosellana]
MAGNQDLQEDFSQDVEDEENSSNNENDDRNENNAADQWEASSSRGNAADQSEASSSRGNEADQSEASTSRGNEADQCEASTSRGNEAHQCEASSSRHNEDRWHIAVNNGHPAILFNEVGITVHSEDVKPGDIRRELVENGFRVESVSVSNHSNDKLFGLLKFETPFEAERYCETKGFIFRRNSPSESSESPVYRNDPTPSPPSDSSGRDSGHAED